MENKRIKLYGLFHMSKKQYLIVQSLIFLSLTGLVVIHPLLASLDPLLEHLPLLCSIAYCYELFETYVVLEEFDRNDSEKETEAMGVLSLAWAKLKRP